MFPTARSQVYYNEAGEPIGWDAHPDAGPEYCDICGYHHAGDCDDDDCDDDDDDDDAECTTPCDGTGYTAVPGVICTSHYKSAR